MRPTMIAKSDRKQWFNDCGYRRLRASLGDLPLWLGQIDRQGGVKMRVSEKKIAGLPKRGVTGDS